MRISPLQGSIALPAAITNSESRVAVIGAGPAGLMAAEVLAQGGAGVTVYDAHAVGGPEVSDGRAGRAQSDAQRSAAAISRALRRRRRRSSRPPSRRFRRMRLRQWSEELGQPTFVGSSGRVFPKAMKASPLLRAWLRRLDTMGVRFRLRQRWTGWDDEGRLLFETPDGSTRQSIADATVLALGGASWPRLGSDGAWVEVLAAKGVTIVAAATSQLRVHRRMVATFSAIVSRASRSRELRCRSGRHSVRGEAIITRDRHRGRRRSMRCRRDCARPFCGSGQATLHIALRPDLQSGDLIARLVRADGKTIVLELAAQGRASFACRHRAAAGSGGEIRRVVVVAVCRQACRPDQRRAGSIDRRGADRARDLDARAELRSMSSTPIS